MNVGRGLFRAWIVVSVLWIVGASSMAYVFMSPNTVRGNFQPVLQIKGGLEPWKIDFSKPLT